METDEYKQTVFKRANIAGSRGCHGKCHFCNVPSMYNAYDVPWRGRSVKNIVDELQFLNTRYGTFIFSFVDSSFEDNIPLADGKKRLAELADEIISRNLTIFYSCCFRAETFKDNVKDHELIVK